MCSWRSLWAEGVRTAFCLSLGLPGLRRPARSAGALPPGICLLAGMSLGLRRSAGLRRGLAHILRRRGRGGSAGAMSSRPTSDCTIRTANQARKSGSSNTPAPPACSTGGGVGGGGAAPSRRRPAQRAAPLATFPTRRPLNAEPREAVKAWRRAGARGAPLRRQRCPASAGRSQSPPPFRPGMGPEQAAGRAPSHRQRCPWTGGAWAPGRPAV